MEEALLKATTRLAAAFPPCGICVVLTAQTNQSKHSLPHRQNCSPLERYPYMTIQFLNTGGI